MPNKQTCEDPVIYRWIAAVLLVAMTLTGVSDVRASVALISFDAEPGEFAIFIFWETASETGNLGFYLERSESPTQGFARLFFDGSDLIPSEARGYGMNYEIMDTNVVEEVRYYYRLQDVPSSGDPGSYSDIISTGINLPPPVPTQHWYVFLPISIK